MGSNCCRSTDEELSHERKTDAIVAGLQDESVKRKVQEVEELAFLGLALRVADEDKPEVSEEEEAFFIDVLERLEKGDEFDSNSIGGKSADGVDSDVEGAAPAADPQVRWGSFFEDEEAVYGMLEPGEAEEDVPLADWELVAAWNQLRHRELPKPDVAARIVQSVARLYAASSPLVRLPAPPLNGRFVIVGDLHGHFGDLFHILDSFGEPCKGPGGTEYLFNGDFVDRGTWGPEVLLTLFCLKLRHPDAVHFNRGNHEDIKQNKMPANGFRDAHCTRAFAKDGSKFYKLCLRSFGQLPLCHILGGEIAVLHGGLPLDPSVKLDEIQRIHRRREIPSNKYVVHGYREGQRVRARRELRTVSGHRVARGSLGQLVRRFKKTERAVVFFDEKPDCEVRAAIRGAPELEEDVELIFESKEDEEQQRSDRLFIALMWSDPIESASVSETTTGPNAKRGAGYRFDASVTQAFLKVNGLRCLVRSHEKQDQGSSVVQKGSDGRLLAVTVFSASNYPSGAGEPGGNKAGVVVVQEVASGEERSLAVINSFAWREPYMEMSHWAGPRMRPSFCELSRQANGSTKRPSARVQALQQLWLLIYCVRPALLKYFNTHDKEMSGKATLEEWISAMRACVIADEDFPWERLARHLVHFNSRGLCHYGAFLRRFQNVLSRRLEARFCDGAMVQALSSLGSDLRPEQEWSAIDRDGNGRLSYAEIRPLLRKHSSSYLGVSADADDDKAFALLSSMDRDLSGFVEREEFLQAMRSPGRSMLPVTKEESETLHHCWAALHSVLRTLALSRFQADAIFHAMDTTKDGWLCRDEFRAGIEQVLDGSSLLASLKDWEPLLWRLIDEDGSGHVSPTELAAALAVVDVTQGLRAQDTCSPNSPCESETPVTCARPDGHA